MNAIVATPALRDRWSQIVERVSSWTPDALLSLGARLSLGAIFFMSGYRQRAQVDITAGR